MLKADWPWAAIDHMKAIVPLAFYLSLFSFSPSAIGAETFLVNLHALDVFLSPASNQLGRITFQSQANGVVYAFTITHPNGSTEQSSFFIQAGSSLQDWSNISKSVNTTYTVGYGPIGITTGQIMVVREIGNPVGSYELTGSPIGTVAGQFGIVRFSGIVTLQGGAYSGQLQGQDNLPGSPQLMGLGGAGKSDFIGSETGIKFQVDTSGGGFNLTRTPCVMLACSWQMLIGYYAKLAAGGITLTVQASRTAAGPWTNLVSIPLTIDSDYAIFRVAIQKSPVGQ
jgi:hypothetical protein